MEKVRNQVEDEKVLLTQQAFRREPRARGNGAGNETPTAEGDRHERLENESVNLNSMMATPLEE